MTERTWDDIEPDEWDFEDDAHAIVVRCREEELGTVIGDAGGEFRVVISRTERIRLVELDLTTQKLDPIDTLRIYGPDTPDDLGIPDVRALVELLELGVTVLAQRARPALAVAGPLVDVRAQ